VNSGRTNKTLGLRLAGVLLLTATATFCQPTDVYGWTRIRWGMTVAEAREAFPGQASDARRVGPPDAILIDRFLISDIRIGRIVAEAAVQTEKDSSQVVAVRLRAVGPTASPRDRSDAFASFKQLLIAKYGTPQNEDQSPDGTGSIDFRVLWVFSSTSITLWWNERTGGEHGSVTVHYEALDRKALEAL
jgi:hypothetical protein